MNVKEIVIAHLKSIGADGLAGDECGCGLDDLMPCWGCDNNSCENCVPAKRCQCVTCNEYKSCESDAQVCAAHRKDGGSCFKPMEVKP